MQAALGVKTAAAAGPPCSAAPAALQPRTAAPPPRRRAPICTSYVGERAAAAGEYHSQDFPWESTVAGGEAAVAAQRTEAAALRAQAAPGSAEAGKGGGGRWEDFHCCHSAARFFKEKRYIPLAFPALTAAPPPGAAHLHVAEIGCGCGSALLPVLKANPLTRATACDVSPTAVELFRAAAEREGIAPDRLRLFAHDASVSHGTDGPLAGLHADCVLMVFTLSALWPRDMPAMVAAAAAALRPGGLLLFRDYGLYDMAQTRFPGAQLLDPEHLVYERQDGTLASFFSVERMAALAQGAGLEVRECEYATTALRNRKKGGEMRRVFLHGVFEKPAAP